MNKKRMSKTNIDWPGLTHTWSPIVGCKHNCPYCIAEKWNRRYHWIPKWDEPQIFQERMTTPLNHKEPCSIFVVFLGDLFGDWVNSDFIRSVIAVTEKTPQHTYWFLTKNPQRYCEFNFGKNCKLGTTITGENIGTAWRNRDNLLKGGSASSWQPELFISMEPLRGTIPFFNISSKFIDLIIVGAQTSPNVAPKKEWIRSIKFNIPAEKIYWKKNIRKYL